MCCGQASLEQDAAGQYLVRVVRITEAFVPLSTIMEIQFMQIISLQYHVFDNKHSWDNWDWLASICPVLVNLKPEAMPHAA